MKIIAIDDNYTLGTPFSHSPNLYLMPDSAILKDGKPFFVPGFSSDFRFSPAIVVRINRLGKNISAKFSSRYYDAVSVGLGVKATDMEAKNSAIANAFDGACIFGEFISLDKVEDLSNLNFSVAINEKQVFCENTKNLILNIDKIIEYVSRYFTLKIGDYIFTGYSGSPIPLTIDNKITGKINDIDILNFKTK